MNITRRDMMKTSASVGVASLIAGGAAALAQEQPAAAAADNADEKKGGRIRQAVCEWCFKNQWKEKDEFCENAKRLGLVGIDLVGPDWFDALKKHGLISSMTRTHRLTHGLAHKENWDECLKSIRDAIEATAAAGFP